MKPGVGLRVGWAVWALNALLWGASLVFWGLGGFPPLPGVDPASGAGGPVARLLFVVVFVAIATLGALILARQSDNPIGWICCAAPVLQGVPTVETDIAVYLVQATGALSCANLPLGVGWSAEAVAPTCSAFCWTRLRAALTAARAESVVR